MAIDTLMAYVGVYDSVGDARPSAAAAGAHRRRRRDLGAVAGHAAAGMSRDDLEGSASTWTAARPASSSPCRTWARRSSRR
jgi:hypothetical protein